MSKTKHTQREVPAQLTQSLERLENALSEWDNLRKNNEGLIDHPSQLRQKSRDLLKKLKEQLDDFDL